MYGFANVILIDGEGIDVKQTSPWRAHWNMDYQQIQLPICSAITLPLIMSCWCDTALPC